METKTLSLQSLYDQLKPRGLKMAYSTLSQFMGYGDIADQLGVGGKGNRREFPAWTLDFLADFLPWYEKSKLNKELAPDAMRHRMTQFFSSHKAITVGESVSDSEVMPSYEVSTLTELPVRGGTIAILEHLADVLEGRRGPIPDRLIGRELAAELLHCHSVSVGRYVKPVRKGVWRESDIFAYIASLSPKL